MKITVSSGSCRVLFDETELYAGQKLRIEGERVHGGFHFNSTSIKWLIPDEQGVDHHVAIKADVKEDVIQYFTSEALKQNFLFERWS